MTTSTFNVVDFGAVGNGTTDDSPAVQAAIDAAAVRGGTVLFPVPPSAYVCKDIDLKTNVTLLGMAPAVVGGGVRIKAPIGATDDIFSVINGIENFSIANLHFFNARRAIWFQNDISGVNGSTIQGTIQWCSFAVGVGIYVDGQMERVYITGCYFGAGEYGFYFSGTRTNANNAILDKTRFDFCNFTGQTKNAIYVNAPDGTGGCALRSSQVTTTAESAIYFAPTGHANAPWSFIDVVAEAAAGWGQTSVSPTTGAITSGSTSLTVASATGLVVGRNITIQGAASGYTDLTTEITNISGTTITVADAAGQTVSNVEVMQAEFSVFDLAYANQAGSNVFMGCIGGFGGNSLYFIRDGGAPTVIGCLDSRPAYSDNNGGKMLSTGGVPLRVPFNSTPGLQNSWFLAAGGGFDLSMQAQRTWIATPPAKDWWALLTCDPVNGGGGGQYGDFQVRRAGNAANGDIYFKVDGMTGNIGSRNAVCLDIASYGTGSAGAPLAVFTGAGSPNNVVAAQIGSLYMNQSGGAGTTLYVKESGAGTNTGWVAK